MSEKQSPAFRRLLRTGGAIAGILICLYCLWLSALVGYSRLHTAYASNPIKYPFRNIDQLHAADAAARLTPSDAEAHLIRGLILQSRDKMGEAIRALERAAALRPLDYVVWMELGLARDQAGETEAALVAFREAARLAPNYTKPRWLLGNVLLRAGKYEDGFVEMSRAAAADSKLLPQLIELAWGIYTGDMPKIEGLIPQTPAARLALAQAAARRGREHDVTRIVRTIETIPDADRRALVKDLLAAKKFAAANEVWSGGTKKSPPGLYRGFIDGGFEEQISFDEAGFGWRVTREVPRVQVSIDRMEPREGVSSLRIDWSGDSSPSSQIVSQLVLVEPGARYLLRFATRSDKLVTGGPPVIAIIDPHSDESREIAHVEQPMQGTSPWQDLSIEFTAGKEAQAILIILRRQGCKDVPCPVYGSLWLDNFSLEKL